MSRYHPPRDTQFASYLSRKPTFSSPRGKHSSSWLSGLVPADSSTYTSTPIPTMAPALSQLSHPNPHHGASSHTSIPTTAPALTSTPILTTAQSPPRCQLSDPCTQAVSYTMAPTPQDSMGHRLGLLGVQDAAGDPRESQCLRAEGIDGCHLLHVCTQRDTH